RVSNRHTFGEIFQIDLSDEAIKQRHRQMICESVLRYLQA
ncbi:TetR family transcriptional regulator, partial [Pseudomonas fluorescens]